MCQNNRKFENNFVLDNYMKKSNQIFSFILFIILTISVFAVLFLTETLVVPSKLSDLDVLNTILWAIFGFSYLLLLNEGYNWIKNGKRSDSADIIAIIFIGVTVYIGTGDVLTAFMGAFSIYLIFGLYELKDYEVLNKIILISVITYNFIFIAGLIDKIILLTTAKEESGLQDTAFSLSFFLMLILGFIIFGRKYMVIFRFMSAQYLSLVFYLIAWIGIGSLNAAFGIDLKQWIYEIIIVFNIIVYFFSGPLVDWMMGYKPTDDPELNSLVKEVAVQMGMNPDRIKVRYGKYPILNAMAYGAYGLDMHMAIIAPEIKFGRGGITKDEIKGVIAHELAHLRGKHTLILTLLTTIQLVIYKLVKIPATFMDYVGTNPEMSLEVYLLINFGVSIILYIFVRILEAKADINARRAGYQNSLAKGLYNLESYYATSHEIGLDATLLSDEKITENNKLINYLTTAKYLNKNMIEPSPGTLLSNLINSHPPSYHRILAILNPEEIKPLKEALLPFSLLSKNKIRDFNKSTKRARDEYISLATQKVKEEFLLADLKPIFEKINILKSEEEYEDKTFAFLHLETGSRIYAKVDEIFIIDEAASPLRYKLHVFDSSESLDEDIIIDPMDYKKVPLFLHYHYNFRKYGIVELKDVKINELYLKDKHKQKPPKKTSNKKYHFNNTGIMIFEANDGNLIEKPIFKTKLSIPLEDLKDLTNKSIFLKTKGSIYPYHKESLSFAEDFHSLNLKLALDYDPLSEKLSKIDYSKEFNLTLDEYLLRFQKLYTPIHGDDKTISNEMNFFYYFLNHQEDVYFILKKAVNSEILGKIKKIEEVHDEKGKLTKDSIIYVESCFEEDFKLEIGKIDSILVNSKFVIAQKKKTLSTLSTFFSKLAARLKPDRILYEIYRGKEKENQGKK